MNTSPAPPRQNKRPHLTILFLLALGTVALGVWTVTPNGIVAQTIPTPCYAGPVTFAVIGDYGCNIQGGGSGCKEQDVADLVLSWQTDIILTVGDNNYGSGPNDGSHADWQVNQPPYLGYINPGRFKPVPGNHDYHCDACPSDSYSHDFFNPTPPAPVCDSSGDPDCVTLRSSQYGLFYGYTLAGTGTRAVGGFTALDSTSANRAPWDLEPDGDPQTDRADWIWSNFPVDLQQLAKSAMGNSSACWRFIHFHDPPYSSSTHHGSNEGMQPNPGSPNPWLYRQWGADAVFAGHDHHYERTTFGGFPYYVVGTGGTGIRDAFGSGGSIIVNEHGALWGYLDANQMALAFVTLDRKVKDYFWVLRDCNRGPQCRSGVGIGVPSPRIGVGDSAAIPLPPGISDIASAGGLGR